MSSATTAAVSSARIGGGAVADRAVQVVDVGHRFGETRALDGVSFSVGYGQIHALLGPNGAGKTTLLRVLSGLVEPNDGEVTIAGATGAERTRRPVRARIGMVPSGSRSFYLRLSGLDNLIFFGRLHGLRRREARRRATERLEAVGLEGHGHRRVGVYSHGMQKRLSVARALLLRPDVLLVDEATHDLDPSGANAVRGLVTDAARDGTAVLWTTQRVEEIRGFAATVTLLQHGRVRFDGSVPRLMAMSQARRFHLRLADTGPVAAQRLQVALEGLAVVVDARTDTSSVLVEVLGDHVLGDVVAGLTADGIAVTGCTEEHSEIERAFLALTVSDPGAA